MRYLRGGWSASTMTALKYPNKKKRKGYWKIYDRARIKDFRKIWDFSLEIVKKLGNPFPKKDKRGTKPKFDRDFYAAICILLVYFDLSLRDMEGEIPLLTDSTLDHSTIEWWFEKLDEDYAKRAVKHLHRKIKKLFKKAEYITDSTKITTTRYAKVMHKGQETIELLCLKLHLIIIYFATAGILSIESLYVTHGDAHDSPIFREELVPQAQFQREKRIHGDKSYFAEENITACEKEFINTNFVPKDNIKHGLILKRAIKEYDNEARKQFRGMIEGLFGGTTIENGNKTRFVKDKCRKTHIALMALSHEIKTYFRALEHKAQSFFALLLDNPSIRKRLINTKNCLLKVMKYLKPGKDNKEERMNFVEYWAEYVRTHSDKEWSKQQNSLIQNAKNSKLTKEQYLRIKGEIK